MRKADDALHRRDRKNDIIAILAGIALMMFFAWIVFGSPFSSGSSGDNVAIAEEAEQTETRTSSEAPSVTPYIEGDILPPFNDGDEEAESFYEWAIWATSRWNDGLPAAWIAKMEINGFPSMEQTFKAVQWQVDQEWKGKDYLTSVSQANGRWVINTGPKETTYWIGETWLSQGFQYLRWDPENPYLPRKVTEGVDDAAVKGDCFNPIRDIKPGDQLPKGSGFRWCPPQPSQPGKEVKGTNPYPDTVTTHTTSVPVPPAIPGYESDNAERVVGEQQESYPGNRDSTTYGTDSGSTTNSATNSQSTGSDGSKTDATIGTEVEYTAPSKETTPSDEESGYDAYAVP